MKQPPQSKEAEQCVISAVILYPSYLGEIDLKPEEFYFPEHQLLFQTILDMSADNAAIDPVTICERLRDRLKDAGGPEYVAEVVDTVDHPSHLLHYAHIVREKWQLRELQYACREADSEAFTGEPDTVIGSLERRLQEVTEVAQAGHSATMTEAIRDHEETKRNPAAVHTTGLSDIDQQLNGGLRDGQLAIIGARPGAGKTVLAAQFAAHQKLPTLFISLEMTRAELAERFLASMTPQQAAQMPLLISDNVFDLDKIASRIRHHRRRDGITMAVVDYLQLVEHPDKRLMRERQVADISRTLKRLAMELQIPVVAASQLNRGSERDNRSPRLSDLRESGAVEQDANIVMLLSRNHEDGSAECNIAKNRNGAPGLVHLTFRPEQFRFENSAIYHGNL